MFVGQCGPGFVAKRLKDSIPLWVLFIAAQWLDIVWCTLVLLGINKVQIRGGYARWTLTTCRTIMLWMRHSSGPWQLVWHIGSGGEPTVGWLRRWSEEPLFSLVLDFITHKPELPLLGNAFKVGLELWRYQGISLVAEIAVLFGGIYVASGSGYCLML